MEILNFTAPASGSWLVDIIAWLVKIGGSVALGVILFTVLLKLITLPFDYVSRASMRKNSLKMEEMRPELEKLQRQYADNKQLYNQKMMALYKKNGYSMFGACLPTILTLVIFIVAINAFTDYSKFQNKTYFYNMSNSYNNVVYAGFDIDESGEYIYRDKNGKFIVNFDNVLQGIDAEQQVTNKSIIIENDVNDITDDFIITFSKQFDERKNDVDYYNFVLYTSNSYVTYNRSYHLDDGQIVWGKENFKIRLDGLESKILANAENNYLKIKIDGQEYDYMSANALDSTKWTAENFILDIRQSRSAETFRNEDMRFLWVKNIWQTDSPTSHPIESSWANFKNTHSYSGADIDYDSLIKKLDYEKNAPNGYFILIALTALSSLVLQIVTTKASKAQMELQTVDGQGMQTQKMMKWIMPIMMAFFAFMYTAAFSLYIVVNSLLSIGMTFGINFIVDRKFKKAQKNQKPQAIRGRVYTPKQEEKEDKKEKKKKEKKIKDDKFAHANGGDFLTGKAKRKK